MKDLITKKVKRKLLLYLIPAVFFFLLTILGIVIMFMPIISTSIAISSIYNKAQEFVESVGDFFTAKDESVSKAQLDFQEEVKKIYNEYGEKGVTLDIPLLLSTVLYNPSASYDLTGNGCLEAIASGNYDEEKCGDYVPIISYEGKKQKVAALATNMVSVKQITYQCNKIVNEDVVSYVKGAIISELTYEGDTLPDNVECTSEESEAVVYTYAIDYDKYREYLVRIPDGYLMSNKADFSITDNEPNLEDKLESISQRIESTADTYNTLFLDDAAGYSNAPILQLSKKEVVMYVRGSTTYVLNPELDPSLFVEENGKYYYTKNDVKYLAVFTATRECLRSKSDECTKFSKEDPNIKYFNYNDTMTINSEEALVVGTCISCMDIKSESLTHPELIYDEDKIYNIIEIYTSNPSNITNATTTITYTETTFALASTGNISSASLPYLQSPYSRETTCSVTYCFAPRGKINHKAIDSSSWEPDIKLYSIAHSNTGKIIEMGRGGNCYNYSDSLGTCPKAGCPQSSGNYMKVQYELEGITYVASYLHLANFSKDYKVGDTIEPGEFVGIMGRTGCSTGVHLHFALNDITNGVVLNPIDLFQQCGGIRCQRTN